uniref:Sorting nexin-2 n=1 Tax=Daphnia magna TaxID=35525 RepID=A0A0P6ESB0_9CRUS
MLLVFPMLNALPLFNDDDLFASAIEIKVEAKADISLEDDRSNGLSPIEEQSHNLSAADEIDLNSDSEYKDGVPDTKAKIELRSEPEDIFEDIPEPKEVHRETMAGRSTLETLVTSPRTQSCNAYHAGTMIEDEKVITAESDGKFITISVKDPQKIGDGISSFLTYNVVTHTNIGLFKKTEMTVSRRFSDFLGLHDKLAEKYLHKGRLVPAPPEKNVVGTTKVKMAGGQTEHEGKLPEFVERRRAALERYLIRIAIHPIFQVDPDFREFLECEDELPRASNTSALSGAGVLRLFNRMGETVTKIAFKMGESDPWFEERHQQLETLESQFRRLQASLEGLYSHRRELAFATAALGKGLALLSNGEDHAGLSRALAKMAELHDKLEGVHNDQSNADFYILHELIKDYLSLLGVVKDVFHERVKAFQTWQHAQQMLAKKREAVDRWEATGRSDKVAPAKDEVLEWEAKVNRSQEEFDVISKAIKKELELFDLQRVKDFKAAFISYLEAQMKAQDKIIEHWETYMPEAKAIA